MKTKLPIIAIAAILVSACTTGTRMAKTYGDDIYFSPADIPPVASVVDEVPAQKKSANITNPDGKDKRIVMSQMEKNADGTSSVNNYIYQPEQKNANSEDQTYNMDNQDLVESDTTAYSNDDDVKYVINNYYDDNDNNNLDYAYRIGRFHNPYFYDPFFYDDWNYGFYSPWNSGYYGMSYGWGYDSWYGGWGYPSSYYGYYSPFAYGFGFGLGGYYGYGGYGGYGGYYGGGSYYNNRQVERRRSTEMNVPGGSGLSNNYVTNSVRSSNLKSGNSGNQPGVQSNNKTNPNTWVENGHTRSRSIDPSGNNQENKSATIVNNRRSYTSADGRRSSTISSQVQGSGESRTQQMVRTGTNTSGNVRRSYEPSTTGRTYNQGSVVRQNQNYTPSYNRPRIVNQANFNNNSYTRPRTTVGGSMKSATIGNSGSTYREPRSSSSMRQTYRSSSSYSNGSNSSTYRSSPNYSSSPSRSSSSYDRGSYSSPSSVGSTGSSYSGGSSGTSSGSSGGSSGGGGGSGHRR